MTHNNRPCYGCEDRYRACQDTCKKPEYIAFIEKSEKAKKAKRERSNIDGFVIAGNTTRKRRNPKSVFVTHRKRG